MHLSYSLIRSIPSDEQMYSDLIYSLAFEGAELRPTLSALAQKRMNLDLQKVLSSNYDDVRVVHSVFG